MLLTLTLRECLRTLRMARPAGSVILARMVNPGRLDSMVRMVKTDWMVKTDCRGLLAGTALMERTEGMASTVNRERKARPAGMARMVGTARVGKKVLQASSRRRQNFKVALFTTSPNLLRATGKHIALPRIPPEPRPTMIGRLSRLRARMPLRQFRAAYGMLRENTSI